jgi:hypothetical protein
MIFISIRVYAKVKIRLPPHFAHRLQDVVSETMCRILVFGLCCHHHDQEKTQKKTQFRSKICFTECSTMRSMNIYRHLIIKSCNQRASFYIIFIKIESSYWKTLEEFKDLIVFAFLCLLLF